MRTKPCPEHKDLAIHLNGFVLFGKVLGFKYTNPPWLFCPWCGRNLTKKEPSKCEHRPDTSAYDYLGAHLEGEARHKRGERQKRCPVCRLWIWESLWPKKKGKAT